MLRLLVGEASALSTGYVKCMSFSYDQPCAAIAPDCTPVTNACVQQGHRLGAVCPFDAAVAPAAPCSFFSSALAVLYSSASQYTFWFSTCSCFSSRVRRATSALRCSVSASCTGPAPAPAAAPAPPSSPRCAPLLGGRCTPGLAAPAAALLPAAEPVPGREGEGLAVPGRPGPLLPGRWRAASTSLISTWAGRQRNNRVRQVGRWIGY